MRRRSTMSQQHDDNDDRSTHHGKGGTSNGSGHGKHNGSGNGASKCAPPQSGGPPQGGGPSPGGGDTSPGSGDTLSGNGLSGLLLPVVGAGVLDALSHAVGGAESGNPPGTVDTLTGLLSGAPCDPAQAPAPIPDGGAPLDPAQALGAVTGALDGAAPIDLGQGHGSMTGALGCLDPKGLLAVDGPVIGSAAFVENNFVADFHGLLEDLGHQLGEPANSAMMR
jgi:hypothetical protein